MARKRVIPGHPQQKDIEKDILSGKTFSVISAQYGIPKSTLIDYASDVLHEDIAIAREKHAEETGDLAREILLESIQGVRKLYRACDEFLTDPDAPERYTLDPRATEVKCVYLETQEDGSRKQMRADLQSLLDRTQVNPNYSIAQIDNRKLMLDTVTTAGKQLETLGRYMGILDKGINATIQLDTAATASKVASVLLDEFKNEPEVVARIVRRLENG